MDYLLFARLVVEVGMPVAQQIAAWAQQGKTVDPADWVLLAKLGAYTSADALAAAGGPPPDKP